MPTTLLRSATPATNARRSEGPVMESIREESQIATIHAFYDVVEKHSTLAYNVAFRMLDNVQDSEDAVQEAFISAYRALPSFDGRSKVSTWLYRIVVNTCLMKIRKDKSRARQTVPPAYDDTPVHDWASDPEMAAMNGDLRMALATGLGELVPELRAAVVLSDILQLTNIEAAEVFDITLSSFKSRLHRGRVLLRKHLEETWRGR